MKFIDFLLKIIGIPWIIIGICWNSLKPHEIYWNLMKYHVLKKSDLIEISLNVELDQKASA